MAANESTFSIDYFHTEFENQMVVDLETQGQISFYNLNGRSFSDAVQVEFSMSPSHRINAKIAAKYYDVRVQYLSGYESQFVSICECM